MVQRHGSMAEKDENQMDMKKYAGKLVHVQLKHPWLLVAPGYDGPPGAVVVDKQTQVLPCMAGEVSEEGALLMSTAGGGLMSVDVDPEMIHSVAVVLKHVEQSLIETPNGSDGGNIILAGG